jgi:hypothetical protein
MLGGRVIPIVVAVPSHGPTEFCRLSNSPLIQSVLKHITPQLIVTHQHAADRNGMGHSASGRQNVREQRGISHKHKHSTQCCREMKCIMICSKPYVDPQIGDYYCQYVFVFNGVLKRY